MQDNPTPSTIVRIKGDYNLTYVLKNTVVRNHELTPEGDHVLVLDSRATNGAASYLPEEEVEKTRLGETMSAA
jgi:hypothetical protein